MTKNTVMMWIGRGGNILLGAITWSMFIQRRSPQCWWWGLGWMAFILVWLLAAKIVKVGRFADKS